MVHRSLVLALIFALIPLPAGADAGLEAQVAAATFPRPFSAQAHSAAHVRVQEIISNFSHEGIEPDTAEVIGWNRGYPFEGESPIEAVVRGWMESGAHRGILVDPFWNTIGCAHTIADDPREPGQDETHFFVCVLLHVEPATPTTPLPDTAMPH